ncbi:serine/threonine protein phosphatase [Thioclava sp. BHET1]|nr:serine/threonine protein phosphatase [Thioclava sp. BHET1]
MGRLSSLFLRKVRGIVPPEPEMRHYLIGDVHGCAELLERLLRQIDIEIADRPNHPARIVFLGDLIDRGPDSAAVLALARERCAMGAESLMGNHEAMLLEFLDRPETGGHWLRNGGAATLASFGLSPPETDPVSPKCLHLLATNLRAALPPGLETWLRARPLSLCSGTLWMVHAGADPELPMPEQQPEVLLWGHPAFESKARRDGLWIAHGHRIQPRPGTARGRIAVDTGAFATGILTAGCVDAGGIRFLFA